MRSLSNLLHRFENKYIPEPNTGCWIWLAATGGNGYGMIYVAKAKRNCYAHRVSFTLFKGEIPNGLIVRHCCDNKLCVNPDHLIVGTHKDNVQDCINRGRRAENKIGRFHLAKLNENDVKNIYKLKNSGASQLKIGQRFGISQTQVSRIMNHKNWKRLKLN